MKMQRDFGEIQRIRMEIVRQLAISIHTVISAQPSIRVCALIGPSGILLGKKRSRTELRGFEISSILAI